MAKIIIRLINDGKSKLHLKLYHLKRLPIIDKYINPSEQFFANFINIRENSCFSLSLSLFLCLSVSLCLSVCLSLSLSLCLSVSLSLCLSLSVSLCLSVCLSLSLSVCLSLPLFLYLSLSLSTPITLFPQV